MKPPKSLVAAAFALMAGCNATNPTPPATASADGATTVTSTTSHAGSTVVSEIFGNYLISHLPSGYDPKPVKSGVAPDGNSFSANYLRIADTPLTWTEAITIEGFKGYTDNPKLTPRVFLDAFAISKGKFCQKSFYRILGTDYSGKHTTSAMIRGCGYVESPSVGMKLGDAYYEIYIAIAGEHDMYLISRFVKTTPFDPANFSLPDSTIAELQSSLMPVEVCSKITAGKCSAD